MAKAGAGWKKAWLTHGMHALNPIIGMVVCVYLMMWRIAGFFGNGVIRRVCNLIRKGDGWAWAYTNCSLYV